MNEIAVKRHSFDVAKNRLKEFSEKTESELEIDKVRTDGGFLGLGDHKVTGYELNRRLETIQEHLIAVNTSNNKVIKEFREVYNALDVLDKDYITSIVANVKAIEKTSNDVRVQQGTLKQHNEQLADQQNKLDTHQVEIEKNVANISKIVTALKVFKEKLDGYKHLTDIDKIWNDCETIQNEIRVVSESIIKFSKKATEDIATANNKNKALSDQVNKDILTLRNEAKSFKEFFSELSEKLESTENLLNSQILVIKEINENFVTVENSLHSIESDILQMERHIEKIDSFIAAMDGYNHLQDIDNMWDDIDICKKNIVKINGNIQMQQNKLDNLATTSKYHTESIATMSKKLEDTEKYAADSRKLITKLEAFKEEVSALNHLMEVDEIWKQTEDHTSKLIECEKRDVELTHTMQKNKEEVNENIVQAVQTTNVAIETLTKKVKYAYWIAGGSAGLAIVELILLLMRVI